ncbi:hypothetical protein B7494_g1487 [Chlorociboria aeruginascens]|nr:hypothetical protein B7494_g1487 [Chlorociboria aeruginascens]
MASIRVFIITVEVEEGYEDSRVHVELMQLLHTGIRLIIISTVITATELSVVWNDIQGVNSVTTAGQIIPLLLGINAIVRLFYLRWYSSVYPGEDDDISAVSGPASIDEFDLADD